MHSCAQWFNTITASTGETDHRLIASDNVEGISVADSTCYTQFEDPYVQYYKTKRPEAVPPTFDGK